MFHGDLHDWAECEGHDDGSDADGASEKVADDCDAYFHDRSCGGDAKF